MKEVLYSRVEQRGVLDYGDEVSPAELRCSAVDLDATGKECCTVDVLLHIADELPEVVLEEERNFLSDEDCIPQIDNRELGWVVAILDCIFQPFLACCLHSKQAWCLGELG